MKTIIKYSFEQFTLHEGCIKDGFYIMEKRLILDWINKKVENHIYHDTSELNNKLLKKVKKIGAFSDVLIDCDRIQLWNYFAFTEDFPQFISFEKIYNIIDCGKDYDVGSDKEYLARIFKSIIESLRASKIKHDLFGFFYFDRLSIPLKNETSFLQPNHLVSEVIGKLNDDLINEVKKIYAADYISNARKKISSFFDVGIRKSLLKDSLFTDYVSNFLMVKDLFKALSFDFNKVFDKNSIADLILFESSYFDMIDALHSNYIARSEKYDLHIDISSSKYKKYADAFFISVRVYEFVHDKEEVINLEISKFKYRNTLNELDINAVSSYLAKLISDSKILNSYSVEMYGYSALSELVVSKACIDKNINQVQSTYETGLQLEEYVRCLYTALSFEVSTTRSSGDFGIDLIVEDSRDKIGIQCKHYSGNVGVDAVMQCYSGAKYYGCNRSILICTSGLTRPALEMAEKLGVELKKVDIQNPLYF